MSNSFWDVTEKILPGHSRSQNLLKKSGEGFSDELRKIFGFGFRRKTLNRQNCILKNNSKISFSHSARISIREHQIWNQRPRKPRNPDFRTKIQIFLRPKYCFCIRLVPTARIDRLLWNVDIGSIRGVPKFIQRSRWPQRRPSAPHVWWKVRSSQICATWNE